MCIIKQKLIYKAKLRFRCRLAGIPEAKALEFCQLNYKIILSDSSAFLLSKANLRAKSTSKFSIRYPPYVIIITQTAIKVNSIYTSKTISTQLKGILSTRYTLSSDL